MKFKMSNIVAISAISLVFALGACGNKKPVAPAESTPVTETPVTETEAVAANETVAAPAASVAAGPSEEDKAKLASLPAPYNAANLENGKKQFALCKACHTIANGAPNGVGPNMHNLIGRKSGTATGFTYSDAMKASGKTWDIATLDEYLKAPKTFIANNKMAFAGIPNDTNRRDVIAYIAVESAK